MTLGRVMVDMSASQSPSTPPILNIISTSHIKVKEKRRQASTKLKIQANIISAKQKKKEGKAERIGEKNIVLME